MLFIWLLLRIQQFLRGVCKSLLQIPIQSLTNLFVMGVAVARHGLMLVIVVQQEAMIVASVFSIFPGVCWLDFEFCAPQSLVVLFQVA